MDTVTLLIMMVVTISGACSGVGWRQLDPFFTTDISENGHELFEIVPRYKRALSFAEEILKRLVAIGTPASSIGHRRRDYLIKGDWESALDSFYAFKPKTVKRRFTNNGVFVFRGVADNKVLTLRSHGGKDGPILDVIGNERNREGKYIDRFIFKDHNEFSE